MAWSTGAIITWFSVLVPTIFAQSQPMLIESKLDGRVLTVVDEYAPPAGGPYQRVGVRALPVNNSMPQYWRLDDFEGTPIPEGGRFYSVNGSSQNSLSVGLLCQSCFPYAHTFSILIPPGGIGGGRLLLRNVFNDNGSDTMCVKNPGMGEFIEDAECVENDDSLLWFLSDRDMVAQ